MSDQMLNLENNFRRGRSDVFPLGRVVSNALVDHNHINRRITNTKEGTNLYPAASNDHDYSVGQHELCLAERKKHLSRRSDTYGGGSLIEAFSTLNGFGKKSDSFLALFERAQCVGVSSNRANYDSTTKNSENDFALVQGGSTTILNTGNSVIRNGDYVMWTLHHPNEVKIGERLPVPVEPYSEDSMRLNSKNMIECILNTDGNGFNATEALMRAPLVDGALALQKGFAKIVIVGLHALMNAGIVKFVDNPRNIEDILDERSYAQRRENSAIFAGIEESVKIEFFKRLSQALGADDDFNPVTIAPVVDKQDRELHEEQTDLKQFLTHSFFPAQDKKYEMFGVEDAVLGHSGDGADLVRMQSSMVDNLLVGVKRSNEFYTNRIIGKAITVGSPGQYFDILLSGYMM